MASFTAGTTFVDGVSNDVTAAKLGALVTNATPTSGLIQDRTAETITATNDTLLIGDASDSNNLKRITVANFAQTLPTAKVTTGTIDTGTFGTTTSTAATITTGTIPTLVATTLVTTGTGTAAAPAIVPTGDTNTGIFFPAADTIAFSEGGTEGMRIDSSGNVGIGVASPSAKLDVNGVLQLRAVSSEGGQMQLLNTGNASTGLIIDVSTADVGRIFSLRDNFSLQMGQSAGTGGNIQFYTQGTERLRIDSSGQVGIGVTPTTTLDVNGTLQLRGPGSEGGQIDFLNTGNASVGMSIDVSSGSNVGRIITAATNSELKLGQLVGTGGIITAHTAAAERMRIDASGNASIGTATALSRLHVHGDLTMSNATVSTTAATGGFTLPATAAGYLTVSINGTSRKIPYYA
jgi:hypothetical protein